MKKNCVDKLIGQYCKIVTKEPGEERASVVVGTVTEIDYKRGFLMFESNDGEGCINLKTIVAIKPKQQN